MTPFPKIIYRLFKYTLRTLKANINVELNILSEITQIIWMPPLHFFILMLIFIKPNKTEALKKIRKPFSMGCECGEVPNDNEYVERHCHESAQLESHHKAKDINFKKSCN